jgi:autotransporter strand-loop-strand O-heptosyltransferase
MKIINVTPGLIPIPPNGWGAVEKIIWEIHQNLLKLGHDSQIKYLNEVPTDADIVHIHVANLANEAHEKGIKYWFTMHDHHAFLYGKDSQVYKDNLKAIKNAVKAFVPAKYLIDYFEGIPEYFSHGVNTDFFKFTPYDNKSPKLLCVANNGFIHDQSEDRKGFGYAIEAAKRLGLPITIVGPENNKKYFEKFPSDYDRLKIVYNVTEEELLEIYKNHSVFLHPSILEAGHPNLTLLEAMSCGLPVLATFEEKNKLEGLLQIERNVNNIIGNLVKVFSDYSTYTNLARNQAEKLSWKNRTIELVNIYKKKQNMREQLIHHYNTTKITVKESKKYLPNIAINNIDGPFVEITGEASSKKYRVEFINKDTGKIEHVNEMGINCWTRCSIKYFVDWNIRVYEDGSLITDFNTDYKGKTVYIAIDSKSLGDTIAWFPYVDEFRKKHECQIICSTFWNDFFEKEYSHIKFIKPGEIANGIVGMYTIGLFYNGDSIIDSYKHPTNPITGALQKVASDILGLEFMEVCPKIKLVSPIKRTKRYVTIGMHSTSQNKYWNNPTGWKEVVEYLKSQDIESVFISKEGSDYMGNRYPDGVTTIIPKSIEEAMGLISGSEFFMGISSGLSWLAWALNKKVVMISGFTEEYNEFTTNCLRLINKSVCHGCWNRTKYDPGDWNFCPDHKGTFRQFECTKSISGKYVVEKIKELIV